jgi:arginyl-tRNA--protein-N-Asp/Glu arginylyltransferase
MYHRIDGEIAGIGVLDICSEIIDSCYFIQNPKFMFLNMGVVGAIRELEYMRKIRNSFNQSLEIYQLGDMVPVCPKVTYKTHYKPGWILCPRTKAEIPFKNVEDTINFMKTLPIE